MEQDPVLCTASSYRDRPLAADAVVAWGQNPCHGRVMLAKEACRLSMRPSQLGQVQCVPDSSGGNCPPPEPACPAGDGKPTECIAATYGAQELTSAQRVEGRGAGRCLAEADLRLAACRLNLDPIALGGIACTPDPTAGECPPKDTPCGDLARKTTCEALRAGGQNLPQPLEAKGDSECAARQALARLACRGDVRPGSLQGVTCRPDK
jgi:hypothetical protein